MSVSVCPHVSDKPGDGAGGEGAAPPAVCPPEGAAAGPVSGPQSTHAHSSRWLPGVCSDSHLPGQLEKICKEQVCVGTII